MPPHDQARVSVLGSINMDLVIRTPRLPGAGETILGGPLTVSPGGKGANQAVAAARLGAAVSMIGAVGSDAYGRELIGVLVAEGVDTRHVRVREDAGTGVASIAVAEGGGNTIIVAPGANQTLSPDDVEEAGPYIGRADVLVLQLEVPVDVALAGATMARAAGTTVVLNAAPALESGLPDDLLRACDVLVVNEAEARLLARIDDGPKAMLTHLVSRGPRAVIITLGDRGAIYAFEREPVGRIEAFPVEAIDTVGAGDAFVGVLATRWAEHLVGGSLDAMGVMDAVCWASAAGALATMKAGAIPSLPTRAEVVRLLRAQGTGG